MAAPTKHAKAGRSRSSSRIASLDGSGLVRETSPSTTDPMAPPVGVETPSPTTGQAKVCGVCGDRAKSFHFGGLSCDSCKAFFRRSVQNDAYKNFQCSYEGRCVITLSTRKSCQYCRLQRCFGIGMEKGWVMTEQERNQMMKVRAEKKQKLQQQQQQQQQGQQELARKEEDNLRQQAQQKAAPYEPDVAAIGQYLNPDELKDIEGAVFKYMQAYQHVPYADDLRSYNGERPGVQIITMFTTMVRRFAFFSRLVPQFASLSHKDQALLLRGGILEMCLLRGALAFDPKTNRWPNTNFALYRNAPVLLMEDARKLVSDKLFDMHMEFVNSIQRLNVDEATIMLLLLIVLFTPERYGLEQVDVVTHYQEYFSNLMRRYMKWRYGEKESTRLFSKLLTKISDLRELSDTHNRYNLRLAKREVSEIQQQLGNMNLNPYPEWNVMNSTETSSATQLQQPVPNADVSGISGSKFLSHLHNQQGEERSNSGSSNHSSSATSVPILNIEENIGLQFMQAMQKSITQVLSAPAFGYEWVTPSMELGPLPDYEEAARLEHAAGVSPAAAVGHRQLRSEQSLHSFAPPAVASSSDKVDTISLEHLEHFRQLLEEIVDNDHDEVLLLNETPSKSIKQEPRTSSPTLHNSPFFTFSESSKDYSSG